MNVAGWVKVTCTGGSYCTWSTTKDTRKAAERAYGDHMRVNHGIWIGMAPRYETVRRRTRTGSAPRRTRWTQAEAPMVDLHDLARTLREKLDKGGAVVIGQPTAEALLAVVMDQINDPDLSGRAD